MPWSSGDAAPVPPWETTRRPRVRGLVATVTGKLPAFDDDYVMTTIAGPMRLSDYLPTRTFELVVHGLDVARATGLVASYDEAVLADAATLAARIAVRTGRGQDLLLAVTGRASPAGRLQRRLTQRRGGELAEPLVGPDLRGEAELARGPSPTRPRRAARRRAGSDR